MSNVEIYNAYLAGEWTGELPEPRPIREELYLAYLCGMDVGELPPPRPIRNEMYLYNLAVNGVPGSGGSGELPELSNPAIASQILLGKEVLNGNGRKMTGTMPDNGAVDETLDVEKQSVTIPAGNHNGNGKVSIVVEEKTVTPSSEAQEVTPSAGKVLAKVLVEASEGVVLPELSNPAGAEHILKDYESIDETGAVVVGTLEVGGDDWKITNCSYLFFEGARMNVMDALLSRCDAVTNADHMFYRTSVESIDLNNFDTKAITNMSYMFANCANLENLNVSGFDTGNVTNMALMFSSCNRLQSLDVSNFNTSKVTTMQSMFQGCDTLTSLDVSNFDTSKVTNMSSMFNDCFKLEEIVGFSATNKAGINIGFPYGRASAPYALKRLTFKDCGETPNMRSAIKISFCSMERSGFLEMIESISDISDLITAGTVTTAQSTITITGNPCVTGTLGDGTACDVLSETDLALATAKGWTVVTE